MFEVLLVTFDDFEFPFFDLASKGSALISVLISSSSSESGFSTFIFCFEEFLRDFLDLS